MKRSTKAFIIYQNKMLLILRDDIPTIPFPNTWNLPGGEVEEGETDIETLKRELLEEITVVPTDIVFLGNEYFTDGQSVARYLCQLVDDEIRQLKLGDEGQKMDFFDLNEALTLPMSPYLGDFLKRNCQMLKQIIAGNISAKPQH